tara:strand:+ start:328 stop:792 length:465 start_codon:yes stop_codon:yes gene_type:complete
MEEQAQEVIPAVQQVPPENTNSEWKSDQIDKLAGALAKAQSQIRGAAKKSKNPFFNSNYADLHTVIESCMPQLSANGISVVQGTDFNKRDGWSVTTMLMHSSGQWIKSSCKIILGPKQDIQALGSAITYGRRYLLSSMAGVGQFDDDGNSISQK